MNQDLHKKIPPFVFKNEILILVAVLGFIGLKYLHFPGRNIISIIGLSTIAGLYYISALYKQNNKADSQLLFYKISGMSSGIIIIGILFGAMHWAGMNMMLSIGSLATISALLLSSIKKETVKIKKETQLRLVVLLLLGSTIYFTFKPDESQLYRALVQDFDIKRVLDEPIKDGKSSEIQEFNEFCKVFNIDLVSLEDHETNPKNTNELNVQSAYFSIEQPQFSKDESEAKFDLTYFCGQYCSYSGAYIYKIKNSKWQQDTILNYKTW